MACLVPVARGRVYNISPGMQFFHAPGIGVPGTNPRHGHDILPVHFKVFPETVQIPHVKKRNVQADMVGGHICIFFQTVEKTAQVPDVVHPRRRKSKRLCTKFSFIIF